MKRIYIGLFLFIIQLYLVFKGVDVFGKMGNPFVLFAVSLAIPIIYMRDLLKQGKNQETPLASKKNYLPLILGIIASLFAIQLYRKGFAQYKDFGNFSDVIPQLNALYERFVHGEQPYYPLPLVGYAPFPVYMPAHWLPLAIPKLFSVDIRWIGLLLVLAAALLFAFFYTKKNGNSLASYLAVMLIPLVMYAYYMYGGIDQFVTIETIVAAYYLILAVGLVTRNLFMVVCGIILCVLSRYTLIFWLPLFAVLLFIDRPFKFSVYVWGAVAASIVLFYVLPFLVPAPNILVDGVAYHNHCAVDEWTGYGNPTVSWTFEPGIYFAPHLKAIFHGTMEQRVFKGRAVQACTMMFLCLAGWLCFRKWKDRVNMYDFGLVSLYIFLICFYIIGVLTYRYYLITPLMLSAVICSRYMALKTNK